MRKLWNSVTVCPETCYRFSGTSKNHPWGMVKVAWILLYSRGWSKWPLKVTPSLFFWDSLTHSKGTFAFSIILLPWVFTYKNSRAAAGGGWCLPSPRGASRCHQNLYFSDGKKDNFVCLGICPSLCLTKFVSWGRTYLSNRYWKVLLLGGHLKVSPVDVKCKCISILNSWKKKSTLKVGITKCLRDRYV